MFFSNEISKACLSSFIDEAKRASPEDEVEIKRLQRSLTVVSYIHNNPDEWSERCKFNIEWMGSNFLNDLTQFKAASRRNLDSIYTDCFRFLCEFEFFIDENSTLNPEMRKLKTAFEDDAFDEDREIADQIRYAAYMMPVQFAKKILNNKGLYDLNSFHDSVEEAKVLRGEWDKEIRKKEAQVSALSAKLDEYETGYNFVGLYKGFDDLAKKKETDRKNLLVVLIVLGISILLPLLIQFSVAVFQEQPSAFTWNSLKSLIPLLSMEVILIYFFRIVLHNYKSVKTQIIQIELRQTLCQFIQSYAEYSAKIKENDPLALEKFENLIFSGILSDSEKLPTTFDGLEHLGTVVKAIKGK
ncbi:hypothetical protein [Vibrio jasicida]|uniref:hypothetical protein n=2 Tax=Vibrio jasicida TaxID=766224 RepID=UPI0028944ADD|nr:conserved hypothetical protein [Vibrio jasicida]